MSVTRVVPLTPALWPAFEALFGRQGAVMGCWCMYWLMARKDWDASRGAANKRAMKARADKGPPPGVLAFIGDEAVGWLQIGPRAMTPQWNGARRVSTPAKEQDAADGGVWAATCFYVKSSARGQGVGAALLDGALKYAKKRGARVVEACPIDGDASAGAAYVGRTALFKRAKFREVARRKPNRPLMRITLGRKPDHTSRP